MIYAVFLMSSIVTGGLFALAARALGLEHGGALVAVAIIGAGLQMLAMILWYLHATRQNADQAKARLEPSAE